MCVIPEKEHGIYLFVLGNRRCKTRNSHHVLNQTVYLSTNIILNSKLPQFQINNLLSPSEYSMVYFGFRKLSVLNKFMQQKTNLRRTRRV